MTDAVLEKDRVYLGLAQGLGLLHLASVKARRVVGVRGTPWVLDSYRSTFAIRERRRVGVRGTPRPWTPTSTFAIRESENGGSKGMTD